MNQQIDLETQSISTSFALLEKVFLCWQFFSSSFLIFVVGSMGNQDEEAFDLNSLIHRCYFLVRHRLKNKNFCH